MALSDYLLALGSVVNDGTGDSLRDGGLKLNALLGETFNPKHPKFGAVGDGVADDGPAWNLTRADIPTNGGVMLITPGSYLLTTAFTFASATNVLVIILSGVVLAGEALPTASGTNSIIDLRSGLVSLLSGVLSFGDGSGVSLKRTANQLRTGGDFFVTGDMVLGGELHFPIRNTTIASSPGNNIAEGVGGLHRIDTSTGANYVITGFSASAGGRLMMVINISAFNLTLNNQDAGSSAANRMLLPNAGNLVLGPDEGVSLIYDATTARWRAVGTAV